jgi:hypothetical protein
MANPRALADRRISETKQKKARCIRVAETPMQRALFTVKDGPNLCEGLSVVSRLLDVRRH